MPLYEYECEKCGRLLEVIQKFSDEPLSECTECGGKLERLLSAPAIQFKGSGWYITDYARKGNGDKSPKEAPQEASKEGKDASTPSASSDAKPAAEAKPTKKDTGSSGAKAAD